MAEEDWRMAENQGHTVKSFDDDLRQLRALISEMGAKSFCVL